MSLSENFESTDSVPSVLQNGLARIAECLPEESVVTLDFKDYGDRGEDATHAITGALRLAYFIPGGQSLKSENLSIVFAHEKEEEKNVFHLYLADRRPSKQAMIGIPGHISDVARSYFGVTWNDNWDMLVNSNLGNCIYEPKSHHLEESDTMALLLISQTLEAFSCFVKGKEDGQLVFEHVRKRERYTD